MPTQLTSVALVLQYWVDRDTLNPGVFIAIFLVIIMCVNYFGVRFFWRVRVPAIFFQSNHYTGCHDFLPGHSLGWRAGS